MNDKLDTIRIENLVIFIYFILLLIYLYANQIEVNYIKYQNVIDKENYRILIFIVFLISFIISLLFTISNLNDLYEYEENSEVRKLKLLSFFAGIFIVIATGIYIYIINNNDNINLEVSL